MTLDLVGQRHGDVKPALSPDSLHLQLAVLADDAGAGVAGQVVPLHPVIVLNQPSQP